MDSIAHGLDLASQFIKNIPGHEWYVAGLIIGSIPLTVVIVDWIKKHYVKKNAEKLASHLIVLNVAFWGFVLTLADFVISSGSSVAGLLPFIGVHWPQISAAAIATHAVATAVRAWWLDRKAGKAIVSTTTPDTSQIVLQHPGQPVQQSKAMDVTVDKELLL